MSPLVKSLLLTAYELSAAGSLPLFKVIALDVPKALTNAIECESQLPTIEEVQEIFAEARREAGGAA